MTTMAGPAAAAGTQKTKKSLLPASGGDAEIGLHIRAMLEQVRAQSRPTDCETGDRHGVKYPALDEAVDFGLVPVIGL